jgi:hypothetical protein
VDAAEPPRILLEGAGPCPSGHRLEALLQSSLGPAHAPGMGWLVSLRLEKTTAQVLRAEGDITDGEGTPVARRVVSGSLADCDALARAIGVWASLVLDAETSRPAPAPSGAPSVDSPATAASWTAAPSPTGAAAPPPTPPIASSAAQRSRDENGAPIHTDARALELGLGTFLMAGPQGRAFAGLTPYAIVEAARGVFLRPSLGVGQGFPSSSSNEKLTWAAARIDACMRMHGLYPANHGLKLDLCAGADGGFTYQSTTDDALGSTVSTTSPFVSIGPSLEMDGDLADALSLVLRGVAGVNIVPDGWSGRIEVALSWRLR